MNRFHALARRMRPVHASWQEAVADLTLDHVNHHERAGVLRLIREPADGAWIATHDARSTWYVDEARSDLLAAVQTYRSVVKIAALDDDRVPDVPITCEAQTDEIASRRQLGVDRCGPEWPLLTEHEAPLPRLVSRDAD